VVSTSLGDEVYFPPLLLQEKGPGDEVWLVNRDEV